MALIGKERSTYVQKQNIEGDERIIINGTQFITPRQLMSGSLQRVFVQPDEPQNAPEGSLWVKTPPRTFTVTGGAVAGGTVYVGTAPNPNTTSCEVTSGQTVYVRCVASSGYSFSSWSASGGTASGTGSATGGTITNISSNITVTASFEHASSTVTSYLLSKGYQTCEYLQSSGSQYIKTGVTMNSENVEIKATLTPMQFGSNYYSYCAGGAYNSNKRGVGLQLAYNTAYCGLGSGDVNLGVSLSVNTEYEIDIKANNGTVSGKIGSTTFSKSYNGSIASGSEYYLFAEHNGTGTSVQNQGRYKVNRFEMILDNSSVRDFIPCYDVESGVGYLWDKLHDVFYQNSGSGSFTVGDDITIDEPYSA